MSGAPITVYCYRDGVDSMGTWITDSAIINRIRNLEREGGRMLVQDTIWFQREPWTDRITSVWPAVDSFEVVLYLDETRDEVRAREQSGKKKT